MPWPEFKHLIIGAGQVGNALFDVLIDDGPTAIRDLRDESYKAEFLHICFPYSDQFVDEVKGYNAQYRPRLVIVHSTVPVGTCDPHGWAHSPIRGRHPNLEEGIRTFDKHVGGWRHEWAGDIFRNAGLVVVEHERARDTEAGKLWELLQYGVNIRVEKQMHEWCAENDVDFDIAYSQFAKTYNNGWARLEPRFVRPVIEHQDGPIGGHCLINSMRFLNHPLARLVDESAS